LVSDQGGNHQIPLTDIDQVYNIRRVHLCLIGSLSRRVNGDNHLANPAQPPF